MKTCLNGATTMPYSLEQDIAAASSAGFEGIEIWWSKLTKFLEANTPAALTRLLSEDHLIPVALCPLLIWPFRDTKPARNDFARAVDLAAEIGIGTLIVCPDYQPARLTRPQAMAIHGQELQQLAAQAAQKNLRLAVEPIGGHTLVPGPKEALELIALAGSPSNVGVVMDTFHYFRSQVPDQEIQALPLDKLYIVHVNDCEDRPLNELKDEHRLYPTLGVMPLKHQLSLLRDKGYSSYLSVEIFRPAYWERPINEIANQSHEYLLKLLSTVS